MSARAPLRVSYRLSLTLALAILVAAAGLGVAYANYRAGKANVEELSRTLFAEVAERLAGETRGFLLRAPPAVESVRRLYEEDPTVTAEVQARRFVAVLRANPGFSWVSFSGADGGFAGAYRTPTGGVRTNLSHLEAGRTVLDEFDVATDGRWTPFRHVDDTHYDPRTRPFYQVAARARHRAWTEPYVFFDQGVPGITCAEPVLGPGGEVRGVFTIDFDLNALSEFVRALHFSAHGRAVVFASDGTLLAHPTMRLVSQAGHGAEGKLVAIGDVDDAPLRRLFAAPADAAEITADGTRYLAARRDVPIDQDLRWTVGVYAPASDFTAGLEHRVVISLAISLGAVALAVVIALLIARRIAVPLVRLAEDMHEVGDFRLDERAGPRSMFREIGMMDDALLKMKRGLRSFARYVPRDLVRAVLASGQDASLAGELRELTIFFSDVAGFTSLSERLPPDELVHLLGGYFDEMTKIIAAHQGTVDKFLGDGIMAFWGAPMSEPAHAALACEAALRCHRRLEELRAGGLPLAARIGLATGEVLVGNIGSSERLNYTVMGDTANLASRLEGLNKLYGTAILVAETTALAAATRVVFRAVDVVAVKGKAQGVRVFAPIALVGERDEARAAQAARAEAALEAYLARDFAEAARSWQGLADADPADQASRVMHERAAAFVVSPPPAGWTGVWTATEK